MNARRALLAVSWFLVLAASPHARRPAGDHVDRHHTAVHPPGLDPASTIATESTPATSTATACSTSSPAPTGTRGRGFRSRHEFFPATPQDGAKGQSNSMYSYVYDFNQDGWPDILVLGRVHMHPAQWYENPQGRSGLWAPALRRSSGCAANRRRSCDIDGDGKPELIGHWEGRWGRIAPDWREPAKPWAFHPITEPGDYNQFYHGTGVGDVNGDGRLDLILNEGWWEQPAAASGRTTWTLHPFRFGERGGAQMFADDVDGDGDNDIITALDAHGWGLAWFEQVRQDGQITFLRHPIMGDRSEEARYGVAFSQPHALDLADIDGDGLKDIVVGKRRWAHGPTGDVEPGATPVLYWFQLVRGADRAVSYRPHLIDDQLGVGVQVIARDINGDGATDILTASKLGSAVYFNGSHRESRPMHPEPEPETPPGTVSPGRLVALLLVHCAPAGRGAVGGGVRLRAGSARGDPPRPLGNRSYLCPERARPLLRPGVQRRPRSALSARALAAAGHGDAGRDPGATGPAARRRGAPAEVPGRHDEGAEPVSPPGGGDHRRVRPGDQRLHRADRATSRSCCRSSSRSWGSSPGRWTPEVVVSRHNGLFRNVTQEVQYARLVQLLGEDQARELLNLHPGRPRLEPRRGARPGADPREPPRALHGVARSGPVPAPRTCCPRFAARRAATDRDARAAKDATAMRRQGSNNWVISGDRTFSRAPILANDPHRAIQLPSLRYWVHLVAPGWNVIGAGEPALPGVSVGHNEHGAWGFTIFPIDQEDLYVYETDPADPSRYRYQGDVGGRCGSCARRSR